MPTDEIVGYEFLTMEWKTDLRPTCGMSSWLTMTTKYRMILKVLIFIKLI